MKRYIPDDSAARKRIPMCSGLLDYFPDALAAVAEVSFLGNEKHNPGQPLHHARGKSMDHPDCIMRHLAERGGFDGKVRHSAALAWRSLANLQEELEAELGLSLPRGATPPGVEMHPEAMRPTAIEEPDVHPVQAAGENYYSCRCSDPNSIRICSCCIRLGKSVCGND